MKTITLHYHVTPRQNMVLGGFKKWCKYNFILGAYVVGITTMDRCPSGQIFPAISFLHGLHSKCGDVSMTTTSDTTSYRRDLSSFFKRRGRSNKEGNKEKIYHNNMKKR
ncbi:hypothetical protein TSUD_255340 [Trifolium subterraneum]|uniref:Uncharacterized protein n=1 Tax=Trifolium subterraneum TaxID=3900 RepID=A0A2Z6NIN5_TRISU|nr:hypothetical protein TSUD_255340 [Trifolium subterraneum]